MQLKTQWFISWNNIPTVTQINSRMCGCCSVGGCWAHKKMVDKEKLAILSHTVSSQWSIIYASSLYRCLDPVVACPKWREAILLGFSHWCWTSTEDPLGEVGQNPFQRGHLTRSPLHTFFSALLGLGPKPFLAPWSETVTSLGSIIQTYTHFLRGSHFKATVCSPRIFFSNDPTEW